MVLGRSRPDVLIVGSVTQDLILTKEGPIRKIGGVTAYAGSTFRFHGIPTAVACAIAPRDRILVDFFRRRKIRLLMSPSPATTRFINMEQQERRLQWVTTLALPIHPSSCRDAIPANRILYLGPLHPDDLDPAWYGTRGLSKKIVALDIQGLVRKIQNGRVEQAVSRYLAPAFSIAHIVKSTEAELNHVTGTWKTSLDGIMDAFGIDEWLVTKGRTGGYLRLHPGETHSYEAESLDRETDPTGAGDVFFACYLIKRFTEKTTPDIALRYAARIAAQQVAGIYFRSDEPLLEPSPYSRRAWRRQIRFWGKNPVSMSQFLVKRRFRHGFR